MDAPDPLAPMRLGPLATAGAPGRIGDPPPVLTWRYHRGDPDGTLRVVRAHGCDIDGGRVTWRDWWGGIVLSEPSELVHHLAQEDADGTADDRPAYADEVRAWDGATGERSRP